ncbi:MAG: RNA methyltransferase [Bacilli bacterium]|nr:RNA methyltransferase [Bacilli bacterium]
MLYTSINNEKIKKLKKLKEKKYRDEEDMFLVEGKHLTTEAYNNGYLLELLVPENSDYKLDVKTNEISKNIIKYLSDLKTSAGIFGICKKKKMKLKEGKILVLDSVQDPGNIGTIIRSSVAFNVDTIVINEKCADIYSDKVIRASQGMIFSSNIIKENLKEFIKKIKKTHKIYVTKVDGGKPLKDIEKLKNFVIIMGSEGSGVSKELLNTADEYLYIPMNKKCESLNVAVATSIILYNFGGD